MIGLLQRVGHAQVRVGGETVGQIGQGLLVLVCAQRDDADASPARLLDKLLALRVFSDAQGKMNRPLRDIDGAGTPGGLLLVPQFTLAADTRSGTRPSFSGAAPPERGRQLFDTLVAQARAAHPEVATGRFGADMQVALVNDGPVTFWLETK
ncbi:D-aminoacyl-tRNA deacylase [Chitinasiproducens palmae]|uniref:D-aminoacyl-tRNA deacylase n=1 Tax=Chitinasiproducens palmae TaxID=1770053 RepID=A0A1H2PQ75_9BURK|nr:D-aminoacyl-tRNA deacylase [Chitinasiproducens palmae]SDV48132.1 D-tyrosyl-tRNA(Tyr) deacylase [Chitinasiproducens palmae]